MRLGPDHYRAVSACGELRNQIDLSVSTQLSLDDMPGCPFERGLVDWNDHGFSLEDFRAAA
ncbi:hypothetical protein MOX02_56660 [Methylobacterium oxalidis]|uniref:Uncharacterized protein n=1 Tax=Methylobacterium oxalidis TaxID=944322 RepID=A0A512JCF7_9HYPH|nr:hypothetical protein MOX02_56660 [Methylobacterium oxalidis]GLS65539.1 hypothetical protein GCM10007888_39210 [Methylobacterium oxalidis]